MIAHCRRSLIGCSVAALAFLVHPLMGQATADTTQLGARVVTATRVTGVDTPIPMATTVIEGDDLRARGITFVADALREVPGMMLVQTGSYGSPLSIFLRGGESDDVKVLLDGVPLNVPGGSINLANLTTDNLDRIEIVRGPASVLYGADAVTGVIQLFTRRGGAKTRADFSGEAGTFGTNDLSGHLDGGNGRWSYSATGSRFNSNGTYAFNSGYRNSVGTGSVGYDGGATGKFSVVGKYGDALDHFPTGSDGSATDHNQFTTETSLDVGLDASRAIGRVELSVHGFASRLNSGFQNMQDTPADTNGFGYDANSTGITWRRGGDARLDWHTGIRSLLSVGAGEEYESDNEQSRDVSNFGFGTEVDTASSDANRITRNVYTQFLAAPTPAISLQLGGRLDDNSAFGTYGTWRVGASWRLASYTRVWGAEGTAIKSPTFSQLFANTAFEVGNPGLTPEHSTNSELGVEQRLRGNHTTLRATFFYQKFKDLIQYVSAAPGDPTYVNLGGTRSRGLELSLISVPSRRLSIAAHWTFLSTTVTDTGVSSSAEVEEGQPLVRRPASSGGATAEYHLGPAMVSVTGSWIGPRYDVDFNSFPEARVTLPSYFTADLGVDAPIRRATSRTMGFDLTLRGENLFNAVYQQALGFPGRGRTLLVGGRLSY